MNVVTFELRSHGKSFIIWFISFFVVLLLFFSMYPSFASSVETIEQVLKNYPPELLKIIGFDVHSFTHFLGFYGYILTYLGMVLFTFAIVIGIKMITVEKSGHLNDFLLVKPMSRLRIWLSKVITAYVYITLFLVLFTLIMLVIFQGVRTSVDMRLFFQIQFGMYLTSLMLLALGFLIASYVYKVRFPGVVGLVSVIVLFVLKLIVSLSNVEKLHVFSPLSYFDATGILSEGGFEWKYVAISIAFIVCALTVGGYRYVRKDIK